MKTAAHAMLGVLLLLHISSRRWQQTLQVKISCIVKHSLISFVWCRQDQ
jgi:hypothetical protein